MLLTFLVLDCEDPFICALFCKTDFLMGKGGLCCHVLYPVPPRDVVLRAERGSWGEDARVRLGMALCPWGRDSCQVPGNLESWAEIFELGQFPQIEAYKTLK